MLRGRNRTDSDNQVIEDLGFSGSLWNGRKNAALVNLACGGYSPHVRNACAMDLPSEGEPFERLVQVPTLVQVLTCMVNAWEPEWGVVSSHPLSEHVAPQGHRGAYAGWLTYISRHRGTVPSLLAPVRIEPVGTRGTLVILTPERPTASNPQDVALLTRLQERQHLASSSSSSACTIPRTRATRGRRRRRCGWPPTCTTTRGARGHHPQGAARQPGRALPDGGSPARLL